MDEDQQGDHDQKDKYGQEDIGYGCNHTFPFFN
jgi:hypothetical protein